MFDKLGGTDGVTIRKLENTYGGVVFENFLSDRGQYFLKNVIQHLILYLYANILIYTLIRPEIA